MGIDPNRSMGDLQCVKSKHRSFAEGKYPADETLCPLAGAPRMLQVVDYWMLNSITDRRKTFDSLLANQFSAVTQYLWNSPAKAFRGFLALRLIFGNRRNMKY